jgi:hypothetical protein
MKKLPDLIQAGENVKKTAVGFLLVYRFTSLIDA